MAQAATLNQQQLARVLSAAANSRYPARNRAIILMQHWSGMRVGEVAVLLYGDVVATDGTIRTEVRLSAAQTKGNKSRTVLLPERLRAELAYYAAQHPTKVHSKPLFDTERSAGFTADTLTHIVNGLYRRAEIHGASSHSGRRTFITKLAEQGISARVLQNLAGHFSLATTQKYIDIKPSMLRAAVELV
jgi:integrase/recombinase XerD